MIEKAKIEALIEKHRLHTPKTPDEVKQIGYRQKCHRKGTRGDQKRKTPI